MTRMSALSVCYQFEFSLVTCKYVRCVYIAGRPPASSRTQLNTVKVPIPSLKTPGPRRAETVATCAD